MQGARTHARLVKRLCPHMPAMQPHITMASAAKYHVVTIHAMGPLRIRVARGAHCQSVCGTRTARHARTRRRRRKCPSQP